MKRQCPVPIPRFFSPRSSAGAGLGVLSALLLSCGLGHAQQVLTVPASGGVAPADIFSGTNYCGVHTNGFSFTTSGGTDPVNLQVTNLPAGVTIPAISVTPASSGSASYTYLVGIAVTNVAAGDYTLTLVASSPNGSITPKTVNFKLHVGNRTFWNATDGANNAWSVAANWSPNVAGGISGADVCFEDQPVHIGTNTVTSSLTIGRLSYLRSVWNTYWRTVLSAGVTLTVTNGFSANSISADNSGGTSHNYGLVLTGGTGSSLIVTNPARDFSLNQVNSAAASTTYKADLSGLPMLKAYVRRFGVGDLTAISEGTVGAQNFQSALPASLTVVAGYTDPNGYSGETFTNAIEFFNYGDSTSYQNGQVLTNTLGSANVFWADSFVLGGSRVNNAGNGLAARSSNSSAQFRNTNGTSRMSLFGVAVDCGTNTISSGARATFNFANSSLDLLTDKLWLGRCRPRQGPAANAHIYGTLNCGGGTIDANTAVLGYQTATNDNDCRGILLMAGGTLVVNNELILGYSYGDFATNGTFAAVGYGQLILSNSAASARINKVSVGGPGNVTTNNSVLVLNNASLTLSNTMGSASAPLALLGLGTSSLRLHLNGLDPRIYARNLTNGGTACTLNIAAITNTGSYPVEVPLISYGTIGGTANYVLGTLPTASPSYSGYLTNDTTAHVIALVLTQGPFQPGAVTWTGQGSADWDRSSTNWLNGTTPYTYSDGVSARFDDSGLLNTINLTTTLSPSQTVVSNRTAAYAFTGAGQLSGTGALLKQGSATLYLANSGNNTFSGGLTIAAGVLQVGLGDSSGSLGTGNITNNASLVFNRADTLNLTNTLVGTGSLSQNGTGTLSLSGVDSCTGATLVNAGTLSLSGSTALSSSSGIQVASAAVLDVSSRLDGTLTLSGAQTLGGAGTIRGNLVVPAGSTLAPGTVGTLTLTGAATLQGTTALAVDKASGNHDMLAAAAIQYGGTLVITPLNGILAKGDSFKLFDAAAYTGAFSSILPATPGTGLAWDTTLLAGSGILKVVSDTPAGLLTWKGSAGAAWDTTSANWLDESQATVAYTDGLPVRFNDSGLATTVTVSGTFSPSEILADNSVANYILTGSGKLTGPGKLVKLSPGTLTLDNSSDNDFSGGVILSDGTLQVGNADAQGSLGSGAVTNNAALVFARSDSVTLANLISGSGSLTQQGGGTLTLATTPTYTGATLISAGTLALGPSVSIASSSSISLNAGATLDASACSGQTFQLANGQTLSGNGSIRGGLNTAAGSTVTPGDCGGQLSVSGPVTLGGTTLMHIDKAAGTNDLLSCAASLVYGNTLVISNLSTALADGDSFKLFDSTNYSGSFTNILPKRPGSGLAWDTSSLADSGILKVAPAPPVTPSASLKIDLSIASRAEAMDPNFLSWPIIDGNSLSTNFNGITITFTKEGSYGTGLTASWWKSGVDDYNCLMADDGLTVANGNLGGQIEMRISGLSAGTHTIATYHNSFDDPAANSFSPMNVFVNGVLTFTNFVPSNRVTNNYDAASAYMQVTVEEDEDVVVLYQPVMSSTATEKNIWINGIEIDTVDSTRKAINPTPADQNEHVDVDSGSLQLGWQAAHSAVSHNLYFGAVSNDVATATTNSALFLGNQTGTNYTVSNLNSLRTYYWRVDEIDATNGVSKGDLWMFRKRHLAFPGAEGYGRFARGGRGGCVIVVTNLADDGPGTFREAITKTLADTGPRTIVFDVSGIITLESPLTVGGEQSKLYIAGQTAPGKGIMLRKYSFGFSGGNDVIVRHLRVFPGKLSDTTLNGMGFGGVDNSIMDHCSSGWSLDECIPSRGAQNMSIQHVMISEPLNQAGHKNYPPGTRHGYASSTSGNIGSWHHDLLAHSSGRNWSLAGGLTGDGSYAGYLDIRCNVIYNWDDRTTDGGVAELNFINNYYKPGAATSLHTFLNPDHGTNADGSYGQRYYSSGNVMPGYPQSNSGGWMTNAPFFPGFVSTESATNAYKIVLSDVGCSQPMVDDHDTRVLRETFTGTYTYVGSASGLPGLPDSEQDVGGWENYPEVHRDASWDSDHDGLPDWWEIMHGLNVHSAPGDYSDANADLVGDEYTELDRYLDFMARPHYDCAPTAYVDIDLSQYTYGFSQTSPIHSVVAATNGTAIMQSDGKTVRFTPTNGFNGLGGLGGIQFRVVDAVGDTMTNVVGIHILGTVTTGNTSPVLAAVADQSLAPGQSLSLTNTATDSDTPAQTLSFSLAVAPSGASIGSTSGIFAWRAPVALANTTNTVSVVVSDNGSPSLSATQSFAIRVGGLTLPRLAAATRTNGAFHLSISGPVEPDYAVQVSTNLVDWQTVTVTNSASMPLDWVDTDTNAYRTRFYRIKLLP